MEKHLQTQHGLLGQNFSFCLPAAPNHYQVSFPQLVLLAFCPILECPKRVTSAPLLQQHFRTRHALDTITILKEGPIPLPQCPKCDLQTATALSPQHSQLESCAKGATAKCQCIACETIALAYQTTFSIDGNPLEKVRSFKYLGRTITDTNDDWPALYQNLRKA